jgi:hypothetical protein
MRTFLTLPAEVRKVLARRELRRRGLAPRPPDDDCRLWLPYMSLAELEQLENLLIAEPGSHIETMTEPGKATLAQILRATLRAIDGAAIPDDNARAALRPLLAACGAVE